MPNCVRCGNPISGDDKFCSQCGARSVVETMPEFVPSMHGSVDVRRDESVRRLLDMAFWHNDSGNTASAMRACVSILAVAPDNVSALSLLGSLHEKQGDIAKAIECFEHIVELCPDSSADIAKLDQLLNAEQHKIDTPPTGYRWVPPAMAHLLMSPGLRPIIAGVSVFFVVLGVGLAALHTIVGQDRAPRPEPLREPVIATTSAPQLVPAPVHPVQPASESPRMVAPTPPPPMNNAAMGPYTSPGITLANPRAIAPQITPLPSASGKEMPSVHAIKPIEQKLLPPIEDTTPVANHTVVVTAPAAQTISPSTTLPEFSGPPAPPPHIEIHFHTPPEAGTGASRIPSAPLQRSGPSNKAADLQAHALKLQNQGSYDQAISEYKSAIDAYQADIDAGRGGDFAKRGIAACKTGISICNQSQ